MDFIQLITNGVLIVGALALAARFLKGGTLPICADTVCGLSLVFIALAHLSQLLLGGSADQDISTFNRMLNNLALYAGIPLLCSTVAVAVLGWSPDKPAWGRWLLALLALFEVTRRAQVGPEYHALMIAACAFALLLPAIRGYSSLTLSSLAAASALALSQWEILGRFVSVPFLDNLPHVLSPVFLAVSIALTSYLCLQTLTKKAA